MLHLPLVRAGRPYRSLETAVLADLATGEPVAEVSRALPALVARDLADAELATARRRAFDRIPAEELLAAAGRAARLFAEADLEVGGAPQSPADYVECLSRTSGLPRTLCRTNVDKIVGVLERIETVLGGLTRGLDLAALDRGWTIDAAGRPVSYRRESELLGVVLPSNSPGVHNLWLPAVALKVGVAAKPGSREPWTPYRLAAALAAAGVPAEAVSLYPGDHAVATEILLGTGRSMLFGDADTVAPWAGDPRVERHGPGWSKVVVGPDRLDGWLDDRSGDLEVIVESVAANGGRSCVNASGVWLTAPPGAGRGAAAEAADAVAEALARRLAAIPALPLDHPEAQLAAFPDEATARRVADLVDRRLDGAVDATARHRAGGRVAEAGGCWFVLPTVVRCPPEHPLARTELLFPFVAVVDAGRDELTARIGPTLAATALTEDPDLVRELMACRQVDRLNLGSIPTGRVVWDQPHEGNLFEHLYRRRALQGVEGAAAAAGAAR